MIDRAKEAVGKAHGKVILVGEHAVVHGCAALAMGLSAGVSIRACEGSSVLSLCVPAWDYRVEVGDDSKGGRALERLVRALGVEPSGMDLVGDAQIPAMAGLGSSAAVAAAAARAIAALKGIPLDRPGLYRAVSASERLFHGNPSGLDAIVVIEGGLVHFSKAQGGRTVPAETPSLIVVSSGEPGDTRTAVARFAERLAAEPARGKDLLTRIGDLVSDGLEALLRRDLVHLGRIMNENHQVLRGFGVSTPALDRICELALNAGALGAKLTGGGGGGCAIALTRPGDNTVAKRLAKSGYEVVLP